MLEESERISVVVIDDDDVVITASAGWITLGRGAVVAKAIWADRPILAMKVPTVPTTVATIGCILSSAVDSFIEIFDDKDRRGEYFNTDFAVEVGLKNVCEGPRENALTDFDENINSSNRDTAGKWRDGKKRECIVLLRCFASVWMFMDLKVIGILWCLH